MDDLLEEIDERIKRNERVLVTTLTKRMAEELTKYLTNLNVKVRYIHSEVDTLERVEILRDLRLGTFDVLVGVNLLREGLDLPEVSLVAILDADKEGFLRNERSLPAVPPEMSMASSYSTPTRLRNPCKEPSKKLPDVVPSKWPTTKLTASYHEP